MYTNTMRFTREPTLQLSQSHLNWPPWGLRYAAAVGRTVFKGTPVKVENGDRTAIITAIR